jgi:hypothetical protein
VRVIVPFAPAGTTDILARLIGQWLWERLGQQFVIQQAGVGIITPSLAAQGEQRRFSYFKIDRDIP